MNKFSFDHEILLLISGGPDSVYLFFHLLKYCDKKFINILHINYNQRAEAIDDENYVRQLAKKHNVKLYFFSYNKNQKNRGNFQSSARKFRYEKAKQVCIENDISEILTGHNKDDCLETIYFSIKRKNKNIYLGIKKATIINGIKVTRPLIRISKKVIIHWLLKNNINYCVDKSNYSDKYTRNVIRKQLDSYSFFFKKLLFFKAFFHNIWFLKKSINFKKNYEKCVINNKIDFTIFLSLKKFYKIQILVKWLNENDIRINKNKLRNIILFMNSKSNKKTRYILNDKKVLIYKNKKFFIQNTEFKKSKKLYKSFYK